MYAIAKTKLPVHVIGLTPATDNAVSNKAYVPGDVIKMHNAEATGFIMFCSEKPLKSNSSALWEEYMGEERDGGRGGSI